jgi:mRNA-degrading endonuclease RelE of RelBE toxin-antitoxin system
MTVELSAQVVDFVRHQAPDPRRRLRLALRKLEHEQGDIKSLEGPLSRYCRLRVGAYRIVFAYGGSGKTRTLIRCVFAERRDIVYEVFSRAMQRRLLEE